MPLTPSTFTRCVPTKPVLNILYMFWTLCMFIFAILSFVHSQNALNELPIYTHRFSRCLTFLWRTFLWCFWNVAVMLSPCVFILLYNRCNLICKWSLTQWYIKKMVHLYVILLWKETHMLMSLSVFIPRSVRLYWGNSGLGFSLAYNVLWNMMLEPQVEENYFIILMMQ